MTRIVAALLLFATLCTSASAASIAGESLPDTYPVDGQQLVLNGIGLRTLTIFNIHAYVAGLYVAKRTTDARAILSSTTPKVVRLRFVHSASKEQVERQYRAGEQNNCGDGKCPQADAGDFERLVALAPAVDVGDTTTYIITARGVRVLANDRLLAEFANPDLGFRLLLGFIGDKPPSEDLKRQLLGLGE